MFCVWWEEGDDWYVCGFDVYGVVVDFGEDMEWFFVIAVVVVFYVGAIFDGELCFVDA